MVNAYTPTNTTVAFPAGAPFPSGYFPTAKQAMYYNEETAMVDAMCLAYTGALPPNRAPVVAAPGIVVSGALTYLRVAASRPYITASDLDLQPPRT